ncbi:peptidoglycan DD-metalloendopeptidase family protein [Arthrobacter sp. NPDC057013]|uniref:M23 family metallopeptidase n=1 Tax=Arthrobacter sp. NPDC057013 TaxID=3345999 RepID=UPI003639C080
MPKHLAPAVARRTSQHLRSGANHNVLSRAVRVGAGAAFLAVYAFGFQGAAPVVSSGQAPTERAGDIAINMPLVSAAVAEAAQGSVSSAGVASTGATGTGASSTGASGTGVASTGAVSASADAFVSYSRTVVFTGAKPVHEKLDVVSTKVRRPAAGTLMAPLDVLVPTSHFGLRTSPISGAAGEFHWGQDFATACGTNVFAADAGVVRAVGWHPWGGGNRVEIDHGNGLITTYNHLEGIGVKKGQSVQVGQLIAKVGTTGSSTGCHLHFETVLNGRHTDPDNWTLVRLRHTGPVSNIKMTDYRKSGTATETPNWAVPVGASAQQSEVHDEHDASAHSVASLKSSSRAKASVAAAKPSGRRAAAPATKAAAKKAAAPKVTAPKPAHRAPARRPATPAPAPKVTPQPVAPAPVTPKPAPTPAATPKPTTPAPTQTPTPTATPAPKSTVPTPAPTQTPVPAVTPAPAATQTPAPAVTPAPSAAPTPAPSPSASAAPKVPAPRPVTAAPAPAAAPASAATPAPVATPSAAPASAAGAGATSTPGPVQAPAQQLTRKAAKEAESARKSKAAAAAATETAAP